MIAEHDVVTSLKEVDAYIDAATYKLVNGDGKVTINGQTVGASAATITHTDGLPGLFSLFGSCKCLAKRWKMHVLTSHSARLPIYYFVTSLLTL